MESETGKGKEMDDRNKVSRADLLKEVKEDLSKSEERLLTDIFDEFLNQPTHRDAILHALKRAVALASKFGFASKNAAQQILTLTKVVTALTVVIAVLTAVLVVLTAVLA